MPGIEKWNQKAFTKARYHHSSTSLLFFLCFSLVHRRWVRLVRKGKGIIWTSGQFSAGDLYGSARRLSASVTRPLTHYCQSQGSSMDDQSMAREKFTPCRAPANTACGRPWKASSWSPVRARQAAETPVTHTQSSELLSSLLLSLFIFLPIFLCIPATCLQLHLYRSLQMHLCPPRLLNHFTLINLWLSFFEETVPKSIVDQGLFLHLLNLSDIE